MTNHLLITDPETQAAFHTHNPAHYAAIAAQAQRRRAELDAAETADTRQRLLAAIDDVQARIAERMVLGGILNRRWIEDELQALRALVEEAR